ncbi:MAG TPA: hypothetical protein VG963_32150 [Polyangiaceae bacterium]|nr:hypothetical protein [Polyangiaceae bacterium]
MRFIDKWLPLIVLVQESNLDRDELAQMSTGLEPFFQRGLPYSVLTVMRIEARPPDALARMRLARWLNQPRVRRISKELCVGSATVTAREGERKVMQALCWLWNPATPHRAVASVSEGLHFCLDRLTAANVALPFERSRLELEVRHALAALPLAGLAADAGRENARWQDARSARERGSPTILADGEGQIALRWLGEGVLWTRFQGQLSVSLAAAYAVHLGQRLCGARPVRYFIDSSSLANMDLVTRNVILQALLANRERLRTVKVLSWGRNRRFAPGARDELRDIVQLVSRSEFEALLLRAAPDGQASFEPFRARGTPRTLD